ncbi:MAG: hypothetical protein H6666_10325 [Ardenticatenaceae bacterium]|nr:hypothetical protein [Anaerolineales bacterium]MCB8918311.1 hypothetical protein [Ardenticatenaceae bacterium]
MFQVNGVYANRKGYYTVLTINGPKMTVRYEDGTVIDLNIAIQERIWENIEAEIEAEALSRAARAERRRMNAGIQFYVKSVSMVAQEEISLPGWRERITVVLDPGPKLRPGSRIIYFSVEHRAFFAVATVTGDGTNAAPKGFFFPGKDPSQLTFYPIDMDVFINNLENAVHVDSVELESQPNFKALLVQPEVYLKVNEDDFELLAELLTELTEEEEEDIEEEEEEFEE